MGRADIIWGLVLHKMKKNNIQFQLQVDNIF